MSDAASGLDGRTILVTGAGGFLGSCVIDHLASQRCTIRRLFAHARPASLPTDAIATIEDHVGDVRSLDTWLAAMPGVDVVIHLAGQTSVYVAANDPAADLAANVQPVLHIVQVCRTLGIHPAVVYAGTATETGLTTSAEPVDETRADLPVTIYDLHKWMSEHYLELYTQEGLLDGVTLRLSNVYGPGPRSSSSDRGFLNAMVRRALAGESLTLYGAGGFVRDYVFVDDVARAFLAAAWGIRNTRGQHFVLGSGCGTTIADALACVAERVGAKTGRVVPIASIDPPTGLSAIERRHFVADTARMQAATGWRPRVHLEEGIDRTIESVRTSYR